MGRKKFDKKSAKTFAVVHRAHDDALYYDQDAPEHVLVEAPMKKKAQVPPPQSRPKKVYTTAELAKTLNEDEIKTIRENEGLAAQYGIFFDDSKYDYMQHLKPIGNLDAVFIEAKKDEEKKDKNIEDLIKDALPSEKKRNPDFDNESIPEEFRGFNPDLDPRLREVMEALEDEAYVEDDDDVFATLLGSGELEDEDEFYYGSDAEQYYNEDYDEWDLDNYEDEMKKYDSDNAPLEDHEQPYNEGEAPEDVVLPTASTGWERDFERFKVQSKNKTNDWDSEDEFEDEAEDEVPSLPVLKNKVNKTKLRKKKGAMTDTSSFSMSSAATFRTEGLMLLDDRYEQVAKRYAKEDEEEEEYQPFDMSQERTDLEGMLDDFLDNYELEGGRRLVKKDPELERLKRAADSVSKGKLAQRRKKDDAVNKLGGDFGKLGL